MITAAQQTYPYLSLRELCRLFVVDRSWYLDSRAAPVGLPPDEIALRDAIERIVLAFPGYGYRRVTAQLQRDQIRVNHKRVLRIMREETLLCQLKRHWVATTNSNHANRIYPNLLTGHTIDRLNAAWVADITSIPVPDAFLYLAAILDAFSRKCIGWHLSRTIDTGLALAALEMALRQRQIAPGLIHHPDRGVQYTSHASITRLQSVGAQISMAGKGNPYENAQAERFFRTLKTEEVTLKAYQTFQEAHANVAQFIDEVYNTKRLHSRLGYRPPTEFEAAFIEAAEIHP